MFKLNLSKKATRKRTFNRRTKNYCLKEIDVLYMSQFTESYPLRIKTNQTQKSNLLEKICSIQVSCYKQRRTDYQTSVQTGSSHCRMYAKAKMHVLVISSHTLQLYTCSQTNVHIKTTFTNLKSSLLRLNQPTQDVKSKNRLTDISIIYKMSVPMFFIVITSSGPQWPAYNILFVYRPK